MDPFTSRLGQGQGRLDSGGFVLGEVEPGWVFELATGDYAEVAQTTDLSGISLVRAKLTMSVPASLPNGTSWQASILVDGKKLASTSCEAGRTRTIVDFAADVSKLAGPHDVCIRLEIV